MQSTSDASGLASRADLDLLTRLEAAVRRGCCPHLKPMSLGGCDQAPHLVAAADAAPLVRQLCCSMGAACHRVHWEEAVRSHRPDVVVVGTGAHIYGKQRYDTASYRIIPLLAIDVRPGDAARHRCAAIPSMTVTP